MPDHASNPEPALRRAVLWLLALAVLFIVYASLYPFDFDPGRLRAARAAGLVRSLEWARPVRSDVIANLLFYLPFGALLTYLTPRRWGAPLRCLAALAAGTALSFLVECAQFATRDRVPTLTDIAVNGAGAALAAAAALAARGLGMRPALPRLRGRRPDPIAPLLVLLWLAFHAAPFMPTARFIRWFRDARLLFDQDPAFVAAAGHFAGYVLLGAALRALFRPGSFWPAFASLAAVSLLARILFRDQFLELDECLGLAAALPVVWWMARTADAAAFRRAAAWTGAALLVSVTLPLGAPAAAPEARVVLDPVHRTATGEPGLIELAYFGIGLVWLCAQAGLSLRRAVPWLLATAGAVELVHALQPGRSAHLAGPLAIAAGAALVRLYRALTRRSAAQA